MHVEHQARALLTMDVEWDWVLVATPRVLADSPFFGSFDPIVVSDAPLSYHVFWRLGRLWSKSGCVLGLATAFFAPLLGPPVLTNYFDANALHEVRDERHLREYLKSFVVRNLVRFSLRRSRALFILSNYGRSRMVEANPASASKWVVAPCGLPPVGPSPDRSPEWSKQLKGPFILYAGAFSENKNQRRLIEAWDKLRRQNEMCPNLVLIGPAPESYLREVIQPERTRTAHPEEVIIPGFVSSEDLAWAFRKAHSYIQPSFAEGFGLPIVEAMSCGTPVACSDSTSMPEVAGNAAILFNPANVESIAEAMEMLVFDEQRRTQLKAAGLKRAKLFTWKRHADIVAGRIREELRRIAT